MWKQEFGTHNYNFSQRYKENYNVKYALHILIFSLQKNRRFDVAIFDLIILKFEITPQKTYGNKEWFLSL